MTGYIHSIQSLGAVDGPGVRSVVFMQGCTLRCAYCHNPDTWELSGKGCSSHSIELTPKELVGQLLKFRPYFGEQGGVTISGGEPLLQAEFVTEVFRLLKEAGIHTALDTAGQVLSEQVEKLLEYTDLALVDVKFLTEQEYSTHAKGSRKRVDAFLALTEKHQVPIWIRHVVVPGLTATPEYLKKIKSQAQAHPNLEKIEWLPFHNLCREKYEKLGIPFPLEETQPMAREVFDALMEHL